MMNAAPDWEAIYRPRLNRGLVGLAFLALPGSDTPDVVRDLEAPMICLGGSVLLAFKDCPDLELSWVQTGAVDFGVGVVGRICEPWDRDRIMMSAEEPWSALRGADLAAVLVHACDGVEGAHDVAIEHRFKGGEGDAVLWVATGSKGKICAVDDLVVSVGRPSGPASGDLTLVRTIQ
ncbi:hypothetical protein M9M90_10705 [Phenylobacterium sp. LH3H17]|uniref:hypothetical protein n=1 Tax=Phenylobacterium sp. LH3H17 TaxID=2903901 RepID=UPI0020C946DE|nr:hypothetical protein [Phenylobacterium sp. LH3H17]UTP37719.1 hypothetical protein M9M90_10705 [Phenylobacterium sp. LH3H17]